MGEIIEFVRPDGKNCPGYLALPSAGKNAPAFVVIQEWWGLNEQIKNVADRLAEQGYRALVPDLFRGKLTQDAGEASHLMNELNFPDAAEQDIRGAVQHLKQHAATKVAVGGFCMGGALTLLSLLRVPEADAGACFYGIPPDSVGDFSQIKKPLICHFAEHDDWCNPKLVGSLEEKLKKGGVDYELYWYDAQHAFTNEKRPEVYDAKAAQLAWDRTFVFLKKKIGS
jgi:carboxymethylenebutenolidase